ncbi:hypothetical protein U9M48_019820 [Paspalum notatum var. saurae]|uniref:Uncharacterized protein n=1 Tax=Paspalum notatum var. saurae TaxID=547442 RepID=A0AAQ3TDG4_PASNO
MHGGDIVNQENGAQEAQVNLNNLKNRARAFAGAFLGMVSPLLLAIVLKKTYLKGNWFPLIFPFLAIVTLEIGLVPFLCVTISELFPAYVSERLIIASKVMVFVSNILLTFLGCGVLLFIHKSAWFSWSVVSACFLVAVIIVIMNVYFCYWNSWNGGDDKPSAGVEGSGGGNPSPAGAEGRGGGDPASNAKNDYARKLEHLLEFSAGITAMMFLVLGSLVLEGLLRSTQLPNQAPAPAPSEGSTTTKQPGTFLAATLFISFCTSAFATFLMNVWTIPLAVLSDRYVARLNIALSALAAAVVLLVTMERMQIIAWLTLLPPLLVCVLSCCGGNDVTRGRRDEAAAGGDEETGRKDGTAGGDNNVEEETKPAPLELTKVTFTGFLAVAVPGITTAAPGSANNAFVFCAATTVLLGLLWRLLTHEKPQFPAWRRAANHSSLFAQLFLICAGIAFGVMAVNTPSTN